MKLIRVIPLNLVVVSQINQLHAFGFTLIWGRDTLRVYAEVA